MWLNSSVNQNLRKSTEGVIVGMLALMLLSLFSVALRKQPQTSSIKPEILAGRIAPDNNRFDDRRIETLVAEPQD
jgi:hypothetical protein